jgi:hypothetical protein
MYSFPQFLRFPNKEGVITHALHRHWYAFQERFRHAPVGACFERCPELKLPVSWRQQPKPQIVFV